MNKQGSVSDPFDLRYQHTCFYLTESIPEDWLQFAIITAHNPGGQSGDELANHRAHLRLQHEANYRGIQRIEITGSDPDDTHQECGFGLLCSVGVAIQLADRFNQLAFYWVDEGRLYLMDTAAGEHVDLGEWACRVRRSKASPSR